MLLLLRHQLAGLLLGAVYLFIGLFSCSIAAIRRRSESRLLVWLGLFMGFYGLRMLADAVAVLHLCGASPWPLRLSIVVDYLLNIPGLMFWIELSRGALRRLLHVFVLASALSALIGLSWYAAGGPPYLFLRGNGLIAIAMLFFIGVFVLVPALSRKYLVIQSRAFGVVLGVIASIALYVNVKWFFGSPPAPWIEPVTFGIWVAALGYEASKRTFDNERRLLSIESELETARQIQAAILPDCVPVLPGLDIAASFHSMSAVAGDFYQFIQPDDRHLGILVADVTGHGVPAALISPMIKVAMQSIADCAPHPSQVLSRLNGILTPELRGRLTSAAYLWLDMDLQCARYSAAGHPALLHWRQPAGELVPIASNGLLFGVSPDSTYPVCNLPLAPGERFLLYTDGLVEPENAHGEPFGDRRLQQICGEQRDLHARDLELDLLAELRAWQPASIPQQDDITLVVIDVL